MKLAPTNPVYRTAGVVAAAGLLLLGGAAQASSAGNPAAAQLAKSSAVCDTTIFATWGTVTNGNSSANAAEYRRAFTGGHAGSANAAEAPLYCAFGH